MSISILMSAYNEEKYVAKTINSLSDQSYKEWELIVIDDGSNDHTRARPLRNPEKSLENSRITIMLDIPFARPRSTIRSIFSQSVA
jgi:glycosyltransferase involved in cell wall biosynthesis